MKKGRSKVRTALGAPKWTPSVNQRSKRRAGKWTHLNTLLSSSCVKKKQWKKLEDTRKDDDLKAFMEKGINGVAFSRTQLQTKFKQWKDSVQSKALLSLLGEMI
jgi:hypothetical protein